MLTDQVEWTEERRESFLKTMREEGPEAAYKYVPARDMVKGESLSIPERMFLNGVLAAEDEETFLSIARNGSLSEWVDENIFIENLPKSTIFPRKLWMVFFAGILSGVVRRGNVEDFELVMGQAGKMDFAYFNYFLPLRQSLDGNFEGPSLLRIALEKENLEMVRAMCYPIKHNFKPEDFEAGDWRKYANYHFLLANNRTPIRIAYADKSEATELGRDHERRNAEGRSNSTYDNYGMQPDIPFVYEKDKNGAFSDTGIQAEFKQCIDVALKYDKKDNKDVEVLKLLSNIAPTDKPAWMMWLVSMFDLRQYNAFFSERVVRLVTGDEQYKRFAGVDFMFKEEESLPGDLVTSALLQTVSADFPELAETYWNTVVSKSMPLEKFKEAVNKNVDFAMYVMKRIAGVGNLSISQILFCVSKMEKVAKRQRKYKEKGKAIEGTDMTAFKIDYLWLYMLTINFEPGLDAKILYEALVDTDLDIEFSDAFLYALSKESGYSGSGLAKKYVRKLLAKGYQHLEIERRTYYQDAAYLTFIARHWIVFGTSYTFSSFTLDIYNRDTDDVLANLVNILHIEAQLHYLLLLQAEEFWIFDYYIKSEASQFRNHLLSANTYTFDFSLLLDSTIDELVNGGKPGKENERKKNNDVLLYAINGAFVDFFKRAQRRNTKRRWANAVLACLAWAGDFKTADEWAKDQFFDPISLSDDIDDPLEFITEMLATIDAFITPEDASSLTYLGVEVYFGEEKYLQKGANLYFEIVKVIQSGNSSATVRMREMYENKNRSSSYKRQLLREYSAPPPLSK